MRRSLSVGFGVLLILGGVLWTLQGLDLLGQSGGMNGHRTWAVIGPIAALIGLTLLIRGLATSARASAFRSPRRPRS